MQSEQADHSDYTVERNSRCVIFCFQQMPSVSGGYYGRNTGNERNCEEFSQFDICKTYKIGEKILWGAGDEEEKKN